MGKQDRISGKMVYKMFKSIVDYDIRYQLLDEVILEDDHHEAYGLCNTHSASEDRSPSYSHFWIDSIAQLAGFALNTSATLGDDAVYISNGWKDLRIVGRPLASSERYESYVRMRPAPNESSMIGDVYVFQAGEVYAICFGMAFRRMTHATLNSVLASNAAVSMPTRTSQPQQLEAQHPITQHIPSLQSPPISTTFSRVLDTLASELGVDIQILTDEANLQDLGLDSLMTGSVLNAIQPYVSHKLPSDFFRTYATVGELESRFGDVGHSESERLDSASTNESGAHTVLTPVSSSDDNESDLLTAFLKVVASEVGTEPTKVRESDSFAALGIDSLLSVLVIAKFKEKTSRSLSSSFFLEHPTFEDVSKLWATPSSPVATIKASSTLPRRSDIKDDPRPSQELHSSPVLLRRDSSSPRMLFLFPDGSGSAASYRELSTFIPNTTIYGFDSPFYTSPNSYALSFADVASLYVSAIRQIQPRGPYNLGGWFLGGIHAFEVARQLLFEHGQEIRRLLLIDSPCPGTLPPLPAPAIDILEDAGFF